MIRSHAPVQFPVRPSAARGAHLVRRMLLCTSFTWVTLLTRRHSKDTIAKYRPANKTTKMTAMPAKRTKRALTVGRPPSVATLRQCASEQKQPSKHPRFSLLMTSVAPGGSRSILASDPRAHVIDGVALHMTWEKVKMFVARSQFRMWIESYRKVKARTGR